MEFRHRPKSNYLHQASWEQPYLLTKNWQSDVKFYLDEIRFFRHLTDQKLIWLQDDNIIQTLGHSTTSS